MYQLVFEYIKQFERRSQKIFLNRTCNLYLKGFHVKQEMRYLEKVFIRNNNFLRCLVKQMMKTVHNGKADPYTTTSLTTEEPSTTESPLICLPNKDSTLGVTSILG